jgi:hypothetical protein
VSAAGRGSVLDDHHPGDGVGEQWVAGAPVGCEPIHRAQAAQAALSIHCACLSLQQVAPHHYLAQLLVGAGLCRAVLHRPRCVCHTVTLLDFLAFFPDCLSCCLPLIHANVIRKHGTTSAASGAGGSTPGHREDCARLPHQQAEKHAHGSKRCNGAM